MTLIFGAGVSVIGLQMLMSLILTPAFNKMYMETAIVCSAIYEISEYVDYLPDWRMCPTCQRQTSVRASNFRESEIYRTDVTDLLL